MTIIDIEMLPMSITFTDLQWELELKHSPFPPIFKPESKEIVVFVQRDGL